MARTPKPWYWAERKSYFVTVNGTRHNLGPDKPAADRKFHELMARKELPPPPVGLSVAEVLDWCQKHREPRTFDFYRDYLQDFLTVSKTGRLPVADLKPFHVVEWADSHGAAWSPAYRRGGITAVQRPFNWAVKLGHIPVTPVPHVDKPRAQRRESAVTAEDWVRIKARYPAGDCFVELLEFCWETGVRPQEGKRVEARHVQPGRGRVVFPAAEAKGRRRVRVVHLTARALELLTRRMAGRRSGPLFVNADGNPWTAHAMACRFGRLRKHVGVKSSAYDFRHGFATRKLVQGHDHLTVAELLVESQSVSCRGGGWPEYWAMKPPLFVRELTGPERQALHAGLRSREAFTLRRARVLLASADGQRPARIAAQVGCSVGTVRNTIHAFEQEGAGCLDGKKRGPKDARPVLDRAKGDPLKGILHQSPRRSGKARSTWTLDLLADVAFEQELTPRRLSHEAVRQAVKRLGHGWKRAKTWITSPDPAYAREKN